MGLEKREVLVAKETDDVLLLVVELIRDIKEKKDASKLMSENLENLMKAVSGVDQLDDELGQHRAEVLRTVGMRVGDLTEVLLTKSSKPPVETQGAPTAPTSEG